MRSTAAAWLVMAALGDKAHERTAGDEPPLGFFHGREEQSDHFSIAARGAQDERRAHRGANRADGFDGAHLGEEDLEDHQRFQRKAGEDEACGKEHEAHVHVAHEKIRSERDDQERSGDLYGRTKNEGGKKHGRFAIAAPPRRRIHPTEASASVSAKTMKTAPSARSNQCPRRRNAARTGARVKTAATKLNHAIVAAAIQRP
jgi:hypothetical protein